MFFWEVALYYYCRFIEELNKINFQLNKNSFQTSTCFLKMLLDRDLFIYLTKLKICCVSNENVNIRKMFRFFHVTHKLYENNSWKIVLLNCSIISITHTHTP